MPFWFTHGNRHKWLKGNRVKIPNSPAAVSFIKTYGHFFATVRVSKEPKKREGVRRKRVRRPAFARIVTPCEDQGYEHSNKLYKMYSNILITKRDGMSEAFSIDKIKNAVLKAYRASGIQEENSTIDQVAEKVASAIVGTQISVEEIQDLVEKELIDRNIVV